MTRARMIRAGVLLAALVGVAAAGVLALSRAAAPEERAAVLPTGEVLSAIRVSRPSRALSSGEIDLLDRVDARQDALVPGWGFEGSSLYTSASPWGRLQLPCIPPEEYDLRLLVTRKRGIDGLDLGIVYGGCQGVVRIDGRQGEASWIDLATVRDPASSPTLAPGKRLRWNRPTEILASVRKDRIVVVVDGSLLLRWSGPARDLRLEAGLRVPNRSALFVATAATLFRIDELAITPVTGTPRFLR